MNSSLKDYSKLIQVASNYETWRQVAEVPGETLSPEQRAAYEQLGEELIQVAKEIDVRVFQFRDSIYVISYKDGVMSVPLKDVLRLDRGS